MRILRHFKAARGKKFSFKGFFISSGFGIEVEGETNDFMFAKVSSNFWLQDEAELHRVENEKIFRRFSLSSSESGILSIQIRSLIEWKYEVFFSHLPSEDFQ